MHQRIIIQQVLATSLGLDKVDFVLWDNSAQALETFRWETVTEQMKTTVMPSRNTLKNQEGWREQKSWLLCLLQQYICLLEAKTSLSLYLHAMASHHALACCPEQLTCCKEGKTVHCNHCVVFDCPYEGSRGLCLLERNLFCFCEW